MEAVTLVVVLVEAGMVGAMVAREEEDNREEILTLLVWPS
jgi:hypothetical protein